MIAITWNCGGMDWLGDKGFFRVVVTDGLP